MRKLKTLQMVVRPALMGTVLLGGSLSSIDSAQAQELESDATVPEASAADLTLPQEGTSSHLERVRLGGFLGGNYFSPENELGNSFHSDQVPGSGFLLGLRGSYLLLDSLAPDTQMDPQLSAELESKYTFSSTEGSSERKSTSSSVLGWRVNALVDFFPDKKLVPFALVGIGGETVMGSNLFMTSPDTDFAAYLGGGLRYALTETVDLRSDLRLGTTASRDDATSALFELHLGASYSFGRPGPEPVKVSPIVATESPRLVDSDRDGIADDDDACPDLAEVLNGIDDKDGCPEVDSDHDGLLGSQDQCPAAAEDVDGFADADGCPDPDNDGDGRPDVIDQCPGKPENLNGFQDEDGCPDEIPEQVQQFTGKIDGIRFKTGSARILRRSRKTLDAAFKVLSENTSVRIEISGHTDNEGSEQNNRALSRKRADYVKWYLVDKGIDADRVETAGYGSEKPLESNDISSGRKANRRIEFHLLPGAATVAPAPGVLPGSDRMPKPNATSAPAAAAETTKAVVPAAKTAAPATDKTAAPAADKTQPAGN